MNALEDLKSFKVDLDQELKKYLDLKEAEAQKISPVALQLSQHLSDLTLRGGKRIRAALLYYSYLAHAGQNKDAALNAAMAMEMSETYLIIHDDIMDDDDLRRGGTTIHRAYFEKNPSQPNYGVSMGILAGDIACAWSNELIAEADFSPQDISRALLALNRVYTIEGFGQAMDIENRIAEQVTPEDVINVHQLKTVPYTFDGPVKIGAILASCNDQELENLSKYTVPLGTAFQIQDDILGMFGTKEKMGKPVTSDLKEGKKTLLILNALQKADEKQKEIIKKNLGSKKVGLDELEKVRQVIIDTGSLTDSKSMAIDLVHHAIEALNQLKLQKEGKDFLLGIAEYMINREY